MMGVMHVLLRVQAPQRCMRLLPASGVALALVSVRQLAQAPQPHRRTMLALAAPRPNATPSKKNLLPARLRLRRS